MLSVIQQMGSLTLSVWASVGKQRHDLEMGTAVCFSREFEQLCNAQYKLISYILGSNVNAEFFARTPDSLHVNDLTFQRIPRWAAEGKREHDQLNVRLDKASGNPEDALREKQVTTVL